MPFFKKSARYDAETLEECRNHFRLFILAIEEPWCKDKSWLWKASSKNKMILHGHQAKDGLLKYMYVVVRLSDETFLVKKNVWEQSMMGF